MADRELPVSPPVTLPQFGASLAPGDWVEDAAGASTARSADTPGTLPESPRGPQPQAWIDVEGALPGPPCGARYTNQGEIASGGMGIVYRAHDDHLNREVAVKVIRREYRTNPTAIRRFWKETWITAQLQHPGVPPIHDSGELPDGSPFIVMKLVRGETLETLFRDRANLTDDIPRLLGIIEQIAQTVAYAHSCGVIHRDLKPANVMVGAFGEVQVMDWGLAKASSDASTKPAPHPETTADGDLTHVGKAMGTPAYMPPEQARGEPVDARADVFALGAILCELLTGQPPYAGGTLANRLTRAAHWDVVDCARRLAACGAHRDLTELARRCLNRDPANRPANAGEVLAAVVEHRQATDLALQQVEVSGKTARTRDEERRRMFRRTLGLLAVFGAVSAGAVFLTYRLAVGDARQQAGLREIVLADLTDKLRTCKARSREGSHRYAEVHVQMWAWLNDPRLAVTRDQMWINNLPTQRERFAWIEFWQEVTKLYEATAPTVPVAP